MRTKFNRASSQPPLADAIRCWAAMNRVDSKTLAQAWQCSESTVSRFLGGDSWPDGPTLGRIIAWLLGAELFHADHCEVATKPGNGASVAPERPA